MSPRARLVVLVAGLAVLLVVFGVLRPVDEQGLRAALDPLGAWAPLGYVAVAAVLGVVLVPGALLAAVAGLLLGVAQGALASLAAATLSAVLARELSRHVGRRGVAEVGSDRLRRAEAVLERHGVWAVVVQRLLPGVPDGPANHAAGLLRVRLLDLVLGTLIGSAPRALSYAVLGDAVAGRDAVQAALGTGLLLLTGALGLALGGRAWRRARPGARRPGARAADRPPPAAAPPR